MGNTKAAIIWCIWYIENEKKCFTYNNIIGLDQEVYKFLSNFLTHLDWQYRQH